MQKSRFDFWQKWLTGANVVALSMGLVVAFAGNSPLFEFHNAYTREVFFQGASITGDLLRFKNWLFGIIGGTIVGFHLLMIMISEHAFKEQAPWAYRAMWAGLLAWFTIDSSLSLYYGAIHNLVLINLFALVMIGLPLVMTRRAFRSG